MKTKRNRSNPINGCQPPWKLTETMKLVELRREGMSYGKIAKRLRRSRGSVIGKANRLGLS